LSVLVMFTGCNMLLSGGVCMHSIKQKSARTQQENSKDILRHVLQGT